MIYACTKDTIEMDLSTKVLDEIETKTEIILQELKRDRDVYEIFNNYIMGVNTALYLQLEYNITTIEIAID